MKQITGKVESVEKIREGNKNGKKWEMFRVVINGDQFTSFDWGIKNKIGQEITIGYKEEQNGQYVNKTLDYLPREEKKNPQLDRVEAMLKVIMQYHGLTLPVVGNVRAYDKDSGIRIPSRIPKNDEGLPQIDVEEDVKPEDLPF